MVLPVEPQRYEWARGAAFGGDDELGRVVDPRNSDALGARGDNLRGETA